MAYLAPHLIQRYIHFTDSIFFLWFIDFDIMLEFRYVQIYTVHLVSITKRMSVLIRKT